MADLSPSSFKDLAVRIFTDHDLAQLFTDNEYRQNSHQKHSVNQLKLYCMLSTSEMHEKHGCMANGGHSAYGEDYKLFSNGSLDKTAIYDRLISNWVNYSLGLTTE